MGYIGDFIGDYNGLFKGDARTSDYGSKHVLVFTGEKQGLGFRF